MSSRYAIAYDVSDDRLRSKVRSVCRKYGARQQYSLFEVQLTPTERAEIVAELRHLADGADTAIHVRIYSVGPQHNDIDIPAETSDGNEAENVV